MKNCGKVMKWNFRIVNSFFPICRVYARGVWYIRHVYISAEHSQEAGDSSLLLSSVSAANADRIRPTLSHGNHPVDNIIIDIAESDRFVNWWVPVFYKLNLKKHRILLFTFFSISRPYKEFAFQIASTK